MRARLRVDLGDVDALWADLRADATTRAVVERGVGRRLVRDPEPLGLRPDVLRPREQRGDVRDGAERLADRALDAVVERLAHEQRAQHVVAVVDRHQLLPAASGAAALVSDRIRPAARCPVEREMPSPDFSRQGAAPASVAPATTTLASSRSPAGSTGRWSASTTMPARAIGWSSK